MTWQEVLGKGVAQINVLSYGYMEVSSFSSHFEPFKNKRTFKFEVTPFGLRHSWLFLEDDENELYFEQDKDGNVYCVLRTKIPTTIKRKNGEKEPRVIPIYDGEQNRLPDDTKVFAGSKGRIEYFPTVWKTAFGHGVSFKLISLQVTHLEEGMGGGCPFPVDTSDEEDQGEIVF